MDTGGSVIEMLNGRLERLRADRVNFDVMWDKIARVVFPTAVGFTSSFAPGTPQNQQIFDATAQLALPRFAAAIDTLVTPQTSKWHMLKAKNKFLAENPAVQAFLSNLNDKLFAVRYSPRSGFAARNSEAFMSMGAFGNGVIYIQDANPGIRYISIHLSEVFIDEDHNGRVDTAYWVHEYTQRQIMQRFPNAKMEDIRADVLKNPGKKIKVCKAVFPRAERDPSRKDAINMPFASYVFRVPDDGATPGMAGTMGGGGAISANLEVLEEKGYRVFPFAVARYMTAPREIYARGPAYDCFPDIMTLQEMSKTLLRYGQLSTDPVYLAADVDAIDPFGVRPGTINYGYLGPDGTERVKPLRPQGDTGFSLEMQNQRREAVNTAFLINMFQVLAQRSTNRMTATEVMQLVQEKGALLAPVGGRLRTEYLGAVIDREIDILFHSNVISRASIPPELIKEPELDIEYDSPLTRTMMAEEGLGIMRTYEFAMQLAQINPKAVRAKLNITRAIERIGEVNGAPFDVLVPEEQAQQAMQQEAQGAATAAAMDGAPGIAQAAMNFAKAQKFAQGQPLPGNPQPGVI